MTDLKQLENKLVMSYFQDGIVDLLIGMMFILDGVLMLTNNTQFVGIVIIFTILIAPIKKKLIIPRVGFVKFRVTREQKIKKSLFVIMIGGILVSILYYSILSVIPTSSFYNLKIPSVHHLTV